ncbi:threonine/homoserine/homoserine lactone efflux protein [Pseudonocardia eucalypti]|uniref:LysE family transporter n=1 Tax=Pseudonocardia eucalypti TaxID=648755 RepID=UPI001614AF91|nr:threonine/homoserine/homoserine lactone efflux protein [Pseudonocardia eucalypti]
MTWHVYVSYLVVVVVVVLVPGPDTMVTLRHAMVGGARRGALAILGIGTASVLQGSAAAVGLGTLVVGSQPLFTAVRWIGAAYLCFLGVQALRSARRGDYHRLDGIGDRPGARSRAYAEGFLCNITNPKVLVMYLSVLPQFLQPGVTSTADALLLAYTVAGLGSAWLLALTLFVHRTHGWLTRRRVRRAMDTVTGTALLGFGARLAVE